MIIGVTGNIGSGKSTVADVFAKNGATIIDGDVLGREVTNNNDSYRTWLRNRFGDSIWNGDVLDRAALGRIVFEDPAKLEELNHAIWPHIRDLLSQRAEIVIKSGGIPVVDAALIYEWDDAARYDLIVAVIVNPVKGAERAARRMGLTTEEMLTRYERQLPAAEKASRADHVLLNDGSEEDLRESAEALWKRIIHH